MNRKSSSKALLLLALGAVAVLALPALAAAKDRNHDRIPDRWENRHGLSLNVDQARRDQDRDSLQNRAEFLAGDNPRDADSDGDGIPDGEENAGTIQSVDASTGKLTIALFGGETLSGQVTEQTEIECGDHGTTASASEDGEDHSGPEQEGEDSPVEDDGEEPGDDAGEGEEAASCTTADLTEGATVKEAELKLENGLATFEKIELEPSS